MIILKIYRGIADEKFLSVIFFFEQIKCRTDLVIIFGNAHSAAEWGKIPIQSGKKNIPELANELIEKEECFEEICIGSLATNIFTAIIKAASGSNISIRNENKQKVIDVLNEILPLLKIMGKDDKKGFENKLGKLWIDPDDDTNVVLDDIKAILSQNDLL